MDIKPSTTLLATLGGAFDPNQALKEQRQQELRALEVKKAARAAEEEKKKAGVSRQELVEGKALSTAGELTKAGDSIRAAEEDDRHERITDFSREAPLASVPKDDGPRPGSVLDIRV